MSWLGRYKRSQQRFNGFGSENSGMRATEDNVDDALYALRRAKKITEKQGLLSGNDTRELESARMTLETATQAGLEAEKFLARDDLPSVRRRNHALHDAVLSEVIREETKDGFVSRSQAAKLLRERRKAKQAENLIA